MEKFGIFELLDALSALTAKTEDSPSPAEDAAYLPPSYGAENAAPPQSAPTDFKSPGAERDALKDFLARHDAIAKKAEEKKKT